jgi:predicted Zn-dependent protease with MMP-like domain
MTTLITGSPRVGSYHRVIRRRTGEDAERRRTSCPTVVICEAGHHFGLDDETMERIEEEE